MKLYFSPGACSMSPHIALLEAGLPFTIEKVDLRSKQTAGGANFLAINPKGYVPALELDDGTVLTEGPAIVQWVADQVPDKQLAPAMGSTARYQLMGWLNFISTEVHKSFSPLFNPASSDDMKKYCVAALGNRFGYLNKVLEGQDYLMGERFSVADGYLFVVLNWSGHVGIDLAAWPKLQAFQGRIAARPAVQKAMGAEGLLK